jgi:CIC family chloride channel protein
VPASDGIKTLLNSGRQALPIVRTSGDYAGVLTRRAATAAMNADDDLGSLTLGDIMDVLPSVASTEDLERALDAVLESGDSDGIPVVDPDGALCGWLPQDAILRTLAAGR